MDFLAKLSGRELEILKLFKAGHTNKEIAGLLFIAEKTVRFHMSNIYEKFQIKTNTCHHKGRKLMSVLWELGLLQNG